LFRQGERPLYIINLKTSAKMKTKTLLIALKLGFDFENSSFEDRDELETEVIEFLSENIEKLPKLKDFCEVSQNGRLQNVNYGNFVSSGEILDYSSYYGKRKQRIYHSSFLHIEADGSAYEMKLYCFSK